MASLCVCVVYALASRRSLSYTLKPRLVVLCVLIQMLDNNVLERKRESCLNLGYLLIYLLNSSPPSSHLSNHTHTQSATLMNDESFTCDPS